VAISDLLVNSVVTITGGTGSFGVAFLERLLSYKVRGVRILSRDELKQDNMRRQFRDHRIAYHVVDVRDRDSLKRSLEGTDYVFHAAALKQVPTGEFFPAEMVKTNIGGSANVLSLAHELGIKRSIFLSTDKAVYPINAMGMTKAIMEKSVIAASRIDDSSKTVSFGITRYGNVICTRGSVIPRFMEQLAAGQQITITNPGMTRFLMSLDEAMDLVLFALTSESNGEIFVKKSPACTIENLAVAIEELLGLPHSKVRFIGNRHGEKLHETLLSAEESVSALDENAYFRVPLDNREMRYETYFDEGLGKQDGTLVAYTSENTERLSLQEIKTVLTSNREFIKLMESL